MLELKLPIPSREETSNSAFVLLMLIFIPSSV